MSLTQALTKLDNLSLSMILRIIRSSRPEVFLTQGVLKTCSKFTGELLCLIFEPDFLKSFHFIQMIYYRLLIISFSSRTNWFYG